MKIKAAIIALLAAILGLTAYVGAIDVQHPIKGHATASNENLWLELGKDPGFNLRRIHKEGITGKGVGIAIMDSHLLVNHIEYKDRLKKYIHLSDQPADLVTIHGTAVASIAMGKNVGVAPGACLYYFETPAECNAAELERYMQKTIQEVVYINKGLPKPSKIRVISVSASLPPGDKAYIDAVAMAKKEGLFLITCNTKVFYGTHYLGLERKPEDDPNTVASYKPIDWERFSYVDNDYFFKRAKLHGELLFVPYDAKTTASQQGPKAYTFHKTGCPSWQVPYIAGLYALACQAHPDITPERFFDTALDTGFYVSYKGDQGKVYTGKIINPPYMIEKLKTQ